MRRRRGEDRGAASIAEGSICEPDGIRVLESFGGSVQGIRHVGVHAGDAVLRWARAHAAGDGFVVGKRFAGAWIDSADGQIIHCAGSGGGNAVGNSWDSAFSRTSTMRCEVSTLRRRLLLEVSLDYVPAGAITSMGRNQTGSGGDVFAQKTAKDVETSGRGDGFRLR